jgi:ABC-type transport system involved in cytochrome bd biosynthesis fused ATPase/permease subunit
MSALNMFQYKHMELTTLTEDVQVPINEMHHSINKIVFILGILLFIASYVVPNHAFFLAGIFFIVISSVLSAYLIHDMKKKLKDTHANLVSEKADHAATKDQLATTQADHEITKSQLATTQAEVETAKTQENK